MLCSDSVSFFAAQVDDDDEEEYDAETRGTHSYIAMKFIMSTRYSSKAFVYSYTTSKALP